MIILFILMITFLIFLKIEKFDEESSGEEALSEAIILYWITVLGLMLFYLLIKAATINYYFDMQLI